MRIIILITLSFALASVASAQSNTGSMGQTTHMGRSGTTAVVPMTAGQPDPGNCGTPDEPKQCPPMPRRALQTYPANRQ